MVTIQDLENSLDEIVTLCTLIKPQEWSYVNILDTKSQTFLCCTSS